MNSHWAEQALSQLFLESARAHWVFAVERVRVLRHNALANDPTALLQQVTSSEFTPQGLAQRVERRLGGGRDPLTNDPWHGSEGRNPWQTFSFDGYGNVVLELDSTGSSMHSSGTSIDLARRSTL